MSMLAKKLKVAILKMDNDTFIHIFWPTFNPSLLSPLDHHITSLQKLKIDDLRVMRVVG